MSDLKFLCSSGASVIGVFGVGGFAREVMPLVVESYTSSTMKNTLNAFFVDSKPSSKVVNGRAVLSEHEFFSSEHDKKAAVIAIGDSRIRESVSTLLAEHGVLMPIVKSSTSTLYDEIEIGEGAVLCANTTITSNVKIGRHFQCNIYSYVAHDCLIGNYVTFAPGVHCNGNVHVGDHAYIGTGAVLRQGTAAAPLRIGEGAVVGMGAVVTKDVPPYTTVIGNPARPLIK